MDQVTIDKVIQELNEVKTFLIDKVEEGISPLKEETERLASSLVKAQADLDDYRRSQITRIGSSEGLMVRSGRFAGYTLVDLNIAEKQFRYFQTREPSERLAILLDEIKENRNALSKSITIDDVFEWEERCIKQRLVGVRGVEPEGFGVFRNALVGWRTQMIREVTKALDSTTSAAGDELVPTFEAGQVWMDVNLTTRVLPIMQQTPMPTSPFDFPVQLGDVNWYPTAENESGVTSTPATAKTTLTAYELKAGVPFSDTLEEDAIIALVPELRATLARNAAEVIDDVLLNGDTTTTNGINSDGATISKSTAGKAHWLLGFDGLVHLAILDNSANMSTAHASTVTAAMFNVNLRKMGKYAAPGRRGEVVHISDVNTIITALTIDEVETVDKFGPRATISSGELAGIYGFPYIMSEQLKLADTDGKVTDAGGNTTGRVLTVNTTQWRVGFRRQITFEAEREAAKSQTTLWTSFRIALTERSGTRSSATHTAITYNISSVT